MESPPRSAETQVEQGYESRGFPDFQTLVGQLGESGEVVPHALMGALNGKGVSGGRWRAHRGNGRAR